MPRPPDDPVPALKQQLAQAIVSTMANWNQWNAAYLLQTDQPRISNLRRGRLERFSLDQLIRLLARADVSVELHLRSSNRQRHLFRAIP